MSAANVVEVRFHETGKCPPGSLAWHPSLGLVDVLEARGWDRVVRVGRPLAGAPELVDVHVRELELVDADDTFGFALAGAFEPGELRDLVEADASELAELRDWEAGVLPPPRPGTAKRRR